MEELNKNGKKSNSGKITFEFQFGPKPFQKKDNEMSNTNRNAMMYDRF